MDKIIDLSHMIYDDMIVHPYDDRVKLNQDKHLKKDGYNNFKLEIGMHAGTHIDSPMHLINSKTFVSGIPLDKFVGRGRLLDVRGQKTIGFKQKYMDIVKEKDIVILYTGHCSKYGTEEYYKDHPVVNKDLAEFFVERKIKMLGMDLPSPDPYPFMIHKRLLNSDILIIENLTNLSALIDIGCFTIIALPLKIRAEASMARVVASID
ncbi:MAG TPA: cyclase family protein [Bacillota bacterium]|nr:cyclase family protein [Bacillota bacterium]